MLARRQFMLLNATCTLCGSVRASRHSYSAHILSLKRYRYQKKEKEDFYGSNGRNNYGTGSDNFIRHSGQELGGILNVMALLDIASHFTLSSSWLCFHTITKTVVTIRWSHFF